MHIVFVVPDGTGIRNYLFSDVLRYFAGHQITVMHSLPPEALAEVNKIHNREINFINIPALPISKKDGLFRDLIVFAQLNHNSRVVKNPAILYSLPKLWKLSGVRKIIYQVINVAGSIAGRSAGRIEKLERYHDKRLVKSRMGIACRQILEGLKPDLVFSTHQRAVEGAYVMAVANQLHIPTVSVIYSWDNLPKSRNATRSNHYFVWSDYMFDEMRMYYPLVPAANVHITGTPQFEEYRKPEAIWPLETFLQKLQLPAGKKLVCFSGSDLSLPNDHLYLKDLIEAFIAMPDSERPHLIVRPAPVDFSGRHEQVIGAGYPWLTYARPLWVTPDAANWTTVFPTPADNELLVNLCYHCHLVVNVGSTMSVDFAMFDKPSIYLNYEQDAENPWFRIRTIFSMQHFRTLDGLDAVVWVKTRKDIGTAIIHALQNPATVAPDRLKWRKLIMNDIFDSSSRIASTIKLLAQKQPAINN